MGAIHGTARAARRPLEERLAGILDCEPCGERALLAIR